MISSCGLSIFVFSLITKTISGSRLGGTAQFSTSFGTSPEGKPAAIVRKAQVDGRTVSIMSFPAGEAFMLPRHTEVQNVDSFMTAKAPLVVLQGMAALGQMAMNVAGDFIVSKITTGAPSIEQRQNSKFLIQANTKVDGTAHGITVTGADPYLLTAIIISEAALNLQSSSRDERGAITPAMIGGADFIRKLLEGAGSKWIAS